MHQAGLGPHSDIMPAAEPHLSVRFVHVSMRSPISCMHPVELSQASSASSYLQTGALLAQRLRKAGDRALQHALTLTSKIPMQ